MSIKSVRLFISIQIIINGSTDGNGLSNVIEFLRMIHREWVEKHGDIYRGWGGTRAIVCIASPELMEVLMTFYEPLKQAIKNLV